MKANESYYPKIAGQSDNCNGISIRNKLAHDYLCSIMINPYYNNYGRTDLINRAFELADLFIKKSNENGTTTN